MSYGDDPSDDGASPDSRRRDLMKVLGVGGIAALAGCGGQSGTDTTTQTTTQSGDGGGGQDTTTTTTTTTTEQFQAQGPGDRQFINASTSEAQNLNPLNISDEVTTNFVSLMYDGGSVIDPDIEFEGRWMSDWQLSDDAQVVDYTLREICEWGADYGQLTAEDYMTFINDIVFNDNIGYTQTGNYILDGEQISYEMTGDFGIRAELPSPRSQWLFGDPLRTAWILPTDLIDKYKPFKARMIDGQEVPPLGQIARDDDVQSAEVSGNLGPFNLENRQTGQRTTFSRNEDYYLKETEVRDGTFEESPLLESYEYQIFDEQSTAYSAIRAGDITTTGVEGRKVEEVSSSDGVKIWESKFGTGVFYLNLNHRVNGWAPIRESREVRQAFAHLLDKQTLIENIFAGHANPADTFHPRWGPYYSPDQITRFEPSVETAREKFATAEGYGYDGDQLLNPQGEQVELKLVIDNTSRTGEIVGNFLKQRLQQAGIATTIEGNSFGKILQLYLNNSVSNNPNYEGDPSFNAGPYNGGAFDEAISQRQWDILYGVGFSAAVYTPWQVINLVLTEEATFNYIGYTTDEFDIAEQVNAAASATSREETVSILSELFGFLSRDQPLNWAFNDNSLGAYRQPVEGLPQGQLNNFTRPNARTLSLSSVE